MDYLLMFALFTITGLLMGSFAGATVWRLRARQLAEDEAMGEEIDQKERKKLAPLIKPALKDRSVCLHCGHMLAWYDLIPLISWASTGGKCRYCHRKIGWFEPAIELAVALFFVVSFVFWPVPIVNSIEVIRFLLWLLAGVLLAILFVYDLKWYLLPNRVVFPLITIGVITATLGLSSAPDLGLALLNLCFATLILSGLYLIFWVVSRGAWIGFGDVKLGLALALLLGQWHLAFLALLAANVIGCLIILPPLVRGKISPRTRVPFGPLLIVGAIVAMLWGGAIIEWYFMAFA